MLFISHRLEEVFEIADRVTVLRDGGASRPARRPRSTAGGRSRRWSAETSPTSSPHGRFRARRRPLRVDALGGRRVLDVTFDVRGGEVLGFAGLVGAGRTDVGLALFGIAPRHEGRIGSTASGTHSARPARRCELGRVPVRGPAPARAVAAEVDRRQRHLATLAST